jgi:hypothetical protein
MNKEQKNWMSNIPKSYRGNYKKAMDTNSKAAAIKSKCLDCTNWQRKEIEFCPANTCPLHPHRPYRNVEKPKNH